VGGVICFLKLDVRFHLQQGLEQGKPIVNELGMKQNEQETLREGD